MLSFTALLATVALSSTTVVADKFRIHVGKDHTWDGIGGQSAGFLLFLNGDADWDCDDWERSRQVMDSHNGDLTQTPGYICEGCLWGDDKPWNWDIERLEFTDEEGREVTDEAPGVITLYPNEGSDSYRIIKFDGADGDQLGEAGTCWRKTEDPQYVQCAGGSAMGDSYHIFTCESDLKIIESD